MTTEAEAIEEAGRIYGSILADPERAEAIRRHRHDTGADCGAPKCPVCLPRRQEKGADDK